MHRHNEIIRQIPFGEFLQIDPKAALRTRYETKVYSKYTDDSPDTSRQRLIDRAHPFMQQLDNTGVIMDLGGGRQIFAYEYLMKHGAIDATIVTVDNVNFTPNQLLLGQYPGVQQQIADGDNLPSHDESIDLAVSNMALDFIMAVSEDANKPLQELLRVLKPGCYLFANLHHPRMIPADIESRIQGVISGSARDTLKFWQFFEKKGLFTTPDQIRQRFEGQGFIVHDIQEQRDGIDYWWEVAAQKPIVEEQYRA